MVLLLLRARSMSLAGPRFQGLSQSRTEPRASVADTRMSADAAPALAQREQSLSGSAVPFFSGLAADDPRDRLLLLSFHFPPSRTVGALRWQKLSVHAAELGWALDVVTLDPSCGEELDEVRLRDLPTTTRVFGVKQKKLLAERLLRSVLRLRNFLRRSISAPSGHLRAAIPATSPSGPRSDSLTPAEIRAIPRSLRELDRMYTAWLDHRAMSAWAADVARMATELADAQDYAAVITSGPPHMVHEAGRRVAAAKGLPFVMDLRDPWSLVQRLPEVLASPLWLRAARRFEEKAIRKASLVIANTEPHRLALQRLYPFASQRIITVGNGCDDEQTLVAPSRTAFVIAYAGSIYLDRDPRPLFRAVALVVRELCLTPAQLQLAFMGSGSFAGVALRRIAADEGIEEFLHVAPGGTRQQALEFMSHAAMLVSLPQDSDMAIPAKVFEYMQFRAWLLALAESHSATALLLEHSKADVVPPNDYLHLTEVIRQRYLQFADGEVPPRIGDDERFSRRRQARILLDALNAVVRSSRVASPA